MQLYACIVTVITQFGFEYGAACFEYWAACWDPYREGQISALDRVQKKAAKFAHHRKSPNWETLASRRKLSRICALFKAYSGERAWKTIGDRLQRPHHLSRLPCSDSVAVEN